MNGPILYVENDENDIFLFNRGLRRIGFQYQAEAVPTGPAAVAYLRGEAPYDNRFRYPLPALLVLDLKMPAMSGLEVLRWVRSQPQFARLPTLILSSSNQPSDIAEAHAVRANAYAIKPGTPRELEALLTTIRDEVFAQRQEFSLWPVAFNQCASVVARFVPTS